MHRTIVIPVFLLLTSSAFAQTANNEPLGGKTSDTQPLAVKKTPPPKRSSTQNKPLSSPCGVRADTIGASMTNEWFSLGESPNKHFWYNPHETSCDPKTSVVKTWMKEVHKNTDSDYALVLYEMKCKTNQLRVKTVIEYDKADNLLETTNRTDDTWQSVAPGTAGEVMLRTVCHRP